jgi:1,2-diacylglycerol 3-alpha-glucosyltransferase
MRLVVMFDNFGPYHLTRLAATRTWGGNEGIAVYGLEALATYSEYDWTLGSADSQKENIFTICPGNKNQRAVGLAAAPLIWQALNHMRPDALAICGYKGIMPLTALLWAKTHGKISVMMSESSRNDKARSTFQEWGKRQLVQRFDAALVGGRRQKEYAAFLGIPEERIFVGYDVVDNEHFARGAAQAREQEAILRRQYGLPKPYFLAVSRFIAKKNLPFLLDAYARYRGQVGPSSWDLVLCGSGSLEALLKEQARDLPGVHFPGFKQAHELPVYYGLASAFILPSSHFEQWGLVVNEAMACGLPVLVSRSCGCAPDLVREGVNGFTFDPQDVDGLARLLLRISSGQMDLAAMGAASREIISDYTPETFAANLLAAIKNALVAKSRKTKNQRSARCDFSA